jgi:pimeloyl-ACP methyl ester carboxylesterase
MREQQLHAYDNRENVLKTIDSGRLTARPPSPEILEQIVEDSMSGSHEATMAYPMESILEDISAEVANINVPTVLLAGELDQVDSIQRHKTEVLAYLPNAEFKIIKGSGHLIPIDEPVQLAKEIASFAIRSCVAMPADHPATGKQSVAMEVFANGTTSREANTA